MTTQPRQKKIVLEFTFTEETHGEDDTSRELVSISRTRSDFTPDELDQLGEEIGQSDRWQTDRWEDIQQVLGDGSTPHINIKQQQH